VDHDYWMNLAFREAERAFEANEVPVGAIIVQEDRIIGRGSNQVEQLQDPTAHAEMIAMTAAANTLGSKWLENCTLYVTLEPCTMCAGAIVLARISHLVYGASDLKAGGCGSVFDIVNAPALNHRIVPTAGIMAPQCSSILQEFFSRRRKKAGGN
jgi:tRNA(adenine34) deaminase